jgi:L,D-peptidoglycan transpeptidase YkuD (ErfK/YbiS/YcfS/YnhG family)
MGPWPAETGFGHLRANRHEGDGSTPIGVFGIGTTLYGNRPDPGGLHERYQRLVCGDWWDENPFSPLYNRFVHVPCGLTPAFAAGSEALWTETLAYPYFAVIDFNTDPIVGGANAPGSGIFLHSWVGGATAGCVALRRRRLLTVLRWLAPAAHPMIAIGTGAQLSAAGIA